MYCLFSEIHIMINYIMCMSIDNHKQTMNIYIYIYIWLYRRKWEICKTLFKFFIIWFKILKLKKKKHFKEDKQYTYVFWSDINFFYKKISNIIIKPFLTLNFNYFGNLTCETCLIQNNKNNVFCKLVLYTNFSFLLQIWYFL